MIKLIPDQKLNINSPRLFSMEMNIFEIARFLNEKENLFLRNSLLNGIIKKDELILFSELNWRLCTENLEIVFKCYPRWNPFSKVVSHYTRLDKNTMLINYNPKKYLNMSDSEITGNIIHEAGHHYGGKHSYYWTPIRKLSAVYLIGYLYEYLSEEMYKRPLIDLNDMDEKMLVDNWNNLIINKIK